MSSFLSFAASAATLEQFEFTMTTDDVCRFEQHNCFHVLLETLQWNAPIKSSTIDSWMDFWLIELDHRLAI